MKNRFHCGIAALLTLVGAWISSSPALGQTGGAFPTERAYQTLYAQAMNQGYPDIAQGVAVFRQYRSGVEQCLEGGNAQSAKAFGEFLDSVVYTFQGYLNSPNLRNRGVRNSIAGYVTQCTALIETYAREKAKRFNGGATRLDAVDENLVATSRQLHGRMTSLLRVGAPSVDGAIRQWSSADLSAWNGDRRFAKAVDSIRMLGGEKEAYCQASSATGRS
jgi:hypothetical protein